MLVGIGWLPSGLVEDWRRGNVDCLEQVAAVPAARLASALDIFRQWAQSAGLQPNEVAYVAATRDRRPLRFSTDDDPAVEQTYRTHWMSPQLSDSAQEKLTRRQSAPPDLGGCRGPTAMVLRRVRGNGRVSGDGGRKTTVPRLCRHGSPALPAHRVMPR